MMKQHGNLFFRQSGHSDAMGIPGLLRSSAPEMVRFGIVGMAATLTHYLALILLVESGGLRATPATGIAFLLALCVTYLGQSYFVFRAADHGTSRLARFCMVALGGLAANSAMMFVVTESLGLSYHIGFVITLMIVPTASFILSKIWVFRQRFAPPDHKQPCPDP